MMYHDIKNANAKNEKIKSELQEKNKRNKKKAQNVNNILRKILGILTFLGLSATFVAYFGGIGKFSKFFKEKEKVINQNNQSLRQSDLKGLSAASNDLYNNIKSNGQNAKNLSDKLKSAMNSLLDELNSLTSQSNDLFKGLGDSEELRRRYSEFMKKHNALNNPDVRRHFHNEFVNMIKRENREKEEERINNLNRVIKLQRYFEIEETREAERRAREQQLHAMSKQEKLNSFLNYIRGGREQAGKLRNEIIAEFIKNNRRMPKSFEIQKIYKERGGIYRPVSTTAIVSGPEILFGVPDGKIALHAPMKIEKNRNYIQKMTIPRHFNKISIRKF